MKKNLITQLLLDICFMILSVFIILWLKNIYVTISLIAYSLFLVFIDFYTFSSLKKKKAVDVSAADSNE